MELEDLLHLSIHTLDSNCIDVSIHPSKLVIDLKEELFERTGIPQHRQRLLYQGVQLDDSASLEETGVQDSLYLVAYVQLEQQVTDLLTLAVEGPVGLLRRRRRPSSGSVAHDRIESINQSLATMEGIVKSKFDSSKRTFTLGQWVDVRDTVDQWLEAQILAVQSTDEGQMVYIHYNGWPSRWDEWIQVNSSRIQPLRSHTFQALDSDMASPCPVIQPDYPGINPRPLRYDLIKHSTGYIQRIRNLMLKYTAKAPMKSLEVSELRLLLDRFGRVMMDLARLMEADQLPVIETMTQVEGGMNTEIELFLLTSVSPRP
mmetsp:Transcript_32971/g.57921  ORF Transcript_32971/g.57921 Transcript_32971/m.57921 type:complete len:316 (-) Transcript_32971:46-993(-)